jgi:hypothetical protein
MAVTVAPSEEALAALVDRINSGTEYDLEVKATVSDVLIDPLEQIDGLRVDLVAETEEQLTETLDDEDRTTHVIRVWIRRKIESVDGLPNRDQVAATKLLTRQLFQRLNQWDSSDLRVKVWDAEMDPKEVPLKDHLRTALLFVASILLRVEVEAS